MIFTILNQPESYVSTVIGIAKTYKLDPKLDRCCKTVSTIVGVDKPSESPSCGQLAVNREQVITALRQDAHYDSLISYLRS